MRDSRGPDDLDGALDRLAGTLGPAAVLRDPSDLERYTRPFRGSPGSTPAVLRPASVDEIRAVVGWARTHLVRLLPQGAASGLVGASTPPVDPHPPTVVVSLERLDGPPMIDPVDRTAIVTAGTRLSRLEEHAAPHGLTLPIDLGADPTIGGMVATNTGGARMLRRGDVRRHVLGVRAVIADEDCSVIDELSTLRKHNMGPSLTHLMVGSAGAFGIVTDVALDLDRRPDSRACAWVHPTDATAVLAALVHLEPRYGDVLEAFEVVSAEALDAGLATATGPHAVRPFGNLPSPPESILVEFAGNGPSAEDRLVEALSELAEAGWVRDALVVDAARAWEPRHRVSDGLRRLGDVIGLDVAVPRPALPALVDRVRVEIGRIDPSVVVAPFGHWADGGVHCNLVVPDGHEPALPAAALRDRVLRIVVDEFGGSFSAEHGIGPHNAAWWRDTVPDATRRLTAEIRSLVDPLGVLGHPGLPF